MGDGGFWHNGLTTGVSNAVVEQQRRHPDHHEEWLHVGDRDAEHPVLAERRDGRTTSARPCASTRALKGIGVKWLKTIRTYSVGTMVKALKEAMTHDGARA